MLKIYAQKQSLYYKIAAVYLTFNRIVKYIAKGRSSLTPIFFSNGQIHLLLP